MQGLEYLIEQTEQASTENYGDVIVSWSVIWSGENLSTDDIDDLRADQSNMLAGVVAQLDFDEMILTDLAQTLWQTLKPLQSSTVEVGVRTPKQSVFVRLES